MAGNPGFSDLETLREGDVFSLHVLGEVLNYRVMEIQTVLPAQVEHIQIQHGQDLCTLITCTPFGVNSHRLLVTGERVAAADEDTPIQTEETPRESVWTRHYRQAVLAGGGIILLALVLAILIRRRKK